MTATQLLSTDTALQVLADQERRRLLRHLVGSSGPVSSEELVEAIATASTDAETPRAQVATTLHHVHLPMLRETGLIEYDPQTETIRYNQSEHIEELLRVCCSN